MALLLRRGIEADRSGITPENGEIIYVTDTQQLFVGDGTTPGGNQVTASGGTGFTGSQGATGYTGSAGANGSTGYTGSAGSSSNVFTQIAVGGQSTIVADSSNDTLNIAAGAGISLTTDAGTDTLTITNTGGGGGGGATLARTTASHTTGSLANGAVENATVSASISYAVLEITVDRAAWVRVYSDTASRTADAGRSQAQDPDPDAGVNAEIITAGAGTVRFTPATVGWNDEATPVSEMYLSITNLSGSTSTVAVTIKYIPLES